MTRPLSFIALCALAIVPMAAAHGNWFATAADTEEAIERKYAKIARASCEPLPGWARPRYGAHSQLKNGVRRWNHFYCGIVTTGGDICLAVAHHVGREWFQVVVTSWHTRGCSSRQIR